VDHAESAGVDVTDEASAVEALGHAPRLVAADAENFKLTWPGDFALAQRLLMTREKQVQPAASTTPLQITLREVTADNLRAVLRLAVRPDQHGYVASNAISLAQAMYSDEAWFRAVYDREEPVGFVMLSDQTLKAEVPPEREVGLWRLMIDARHQRRGIGREVIRLVLEHVRTRPDVRTFYTSYVPEPGGPGPFYRGLGFEPTGLMDEDEVVVVYPLDRQGGHEKDAE
jgi:diamine N-acetyltransferase